MLKIKPMQSRPLNVVISGGSSGLGKSMARLFSQMGDNVIIFSRNNIERTMLINKDISGFTCDVSDIESMTQMHKAIQTRFQHVDIYINNAAYSGGYSMFVEQSDEKLKEIVSTNIFGNILGTKKAIDLMAKQDVPGHIFFVSGSTDNIGYSTYGATKSAISQLYKNIRNEPVGEMVRFHMISPGMMWTPLLTENTHDNSALNTIFNIMCESPDTVAEDLVPRLRNVVYCDNKSQFIRYFNVIGILKRALLPSSKHL